jgi:hypothetical protein
LIYSRKKIKDLKSGDISSIELNDDIKAITFNKKVQYNGEALCTLDLKAISFGEKVAIIPKCKHIFHYDCLKAKQEEQTFQGCPLCNQEKVIETNRA